MSVFVVDKRKKPLMPCSEKRARLLLARDRARVIKMYPFTIRIVDRTLQESAVQSVAIKLDPGSKTTGIAILRENGEKNVVLFLAELKHRGQQIRDALEARASMRRNRRNALRYRPARFLNRIKPKGWLAPSLTHRMQTTLAWVQRFCKLVPASRLAMELVRFDTQLLENPEIFGIGYQQGTLAGYELREFLLNKWGRQCAYCDAKNIPLQIEHIVSRAHGGSSRESNLTLACQKCNHAKGAHAIEKFLHKKPEVLAKILSRVKRPLKDAAAVNVTRWALYNALKCHALPLITGSGGKTKWNRTCLGVPKMHALDAACVGETKTLFNWTIPVFHIQAVGRGAYRRTRLDKYGSRRGLLMRQKSVKGFKTGDIVKAIVEKGKNIGTYVGKVAVRITGSFAIQTLKGKVDGVNAKYCKLLQKGDGYAYI